MNSLKNTREVVEYLSSHVSGQTLDYGAGTAKYRSIVEPHSSKYVAFDMVASSNVDIVGDVLMPPFHDESFNTIICTQVLEHVEKPWIVASQIRRILKKDGIAIVSAPFVFPYHADPYDFFRYTRQGLESLFKNEGFEIVESGTYGKMFSVFSEMIHFSVWNPYKPEGRTIWAGRAVRYMEKLAAFLDKFVENKTIYPNSYIVVKKK